MHKYAMLIQWEQESSCYVVSVPELPGCMADGETPQEAVENVQIIIDEWIETAQELGREIPQPLVQRLRITQ